jgi:hypothetical protein
MIGARVFLAVFLVAYIGLAVWAVRDVTHALSKPSAAKACVVKPRVML